MRIFLLLSIVIFVSFFMFAEESDSAVAKKAIIIHAERTDEPIKVDGILDESIWEYGNCHEKPVSDLFLGNHLRRLFVFK